MKCSNSKWTLALALLCAGVVSTGLDAAAENCVTQSQMQPADRDALAGAARAIALKVQANDQAGLQSSTIPEFASNFSGIAQAVSTTAPALAGDTAEVEQIYVLDATDKKRNADGSMPDTEFLCNLN